MINQMVPHALGFLRGALRFGAKPHELRPALEKEFPRLSEVEVEELLIGEQKFGFYIFIP